MSRADEAAQATSAEEFAKKWIKATDRAYDTVDVQELVALSAPSCVSCQNYIRSVRHAAATGERYRGGQTVIRSAAAPPLESGETIVAVDVSVPETQVLNRDGVVTRTVPPLKQGILNVTVRQLAGRWSVMGLFAVEGVVVGASLRG